MSVKANEFIVGGASEPSWQAIIPGASQVVAFTGSSAQSVALAAATTLIRVTSNQDCFLAFGSNPTATNTAFFLPAGAVDYLGVTPGTKVAALQATAGGNLYLTEAK